MATVCILNSPRLGTETIPPRDWLIIFFLRAILSPRAGDM